MTRPRVKFTVNDYMTAPPDELFQLLDGEMVLAPSPTSSHQRISGRLFLALQEFVSSHDLGEVWFAPLDVVLSEHDVAQPDLLFVSNARSSVITQANIQGAPDLVVEVLSPGTAEYDRGYKRTLYGRSGVLEYWLVDPETRTIEVMTEGGERMTVHSTYSSDDNLESPMLPGLTLPLAEIFR